MAQGVKTDGPRSWRVCTPVLPFALCSPPKWLWAKGRTGTFFFFKCHFGLCFGFPSRGRRSAWCLPEHLSDSIPTTAREVVYQLHFTDEEPETGNEVSRLILPLVWQHWALNLGVRSEGMLGPFPSLHICFSVGSLMGNRPEQLGPRPRDGRHAGEGRTLWLDLYTHKPGSVGVRNVQVCKQRRCLLVCLTDEPVMGLSGATQQFILGVGVRAQVLVTLGVLVLVRMCRKYIYLVEILCSQGQQFSTLLYIRIIWGTFQYSRLHLRPSISEPLRWAWASASQVIPC